MSKAYDNAKELEYINYDSTNNRINFSVSISSNNAPVASQQVYDANTSNVAFFSLPAGNTAQRPASPANGAIRYNTTTSAGEMYFASSGWASFAGEPIITDVTPGTFNGTSGTAFNISGVRFNQDAQIYFITSNGSSYVAGTVAFYSASLIVATTPRNFTIADEPLSVKIVQNSGTYIKTNIIDCGGVPNWITTAGNLGSIFGANTVNVYVSATDPEGNAVTYTIASGTLPSGLSLTSANGLIQGLNPGVTTNTTYNFTITASDSINTTDRAFNYIILNRPPVWNTSATLSDITDDQIDTYVANTTVNAYDPDGGVISYTLTSGSVPSGMTFVTANGALAGAPTRVDSNTTSTFTVTATDVGSLANARTFTITVLPYTDPQFANTVLLIHGNANTVIKDASSNNYPLTVVGDTRGSIFNPFNTSWANYFDNSGTNGFSFPQHADYSLGTGDFTVEAFVYLNGTNGNNNYPVIIYGWGPQGGSPASYASWTITLPSLTSLRWYRYDGTETYYDFGYTFAQRTWYHIAVTRSGTSLRAFVNGQQIGTTQTNSTSFNLVNGSSGGSDLLYVGKTGGGGAATFPGYISNLRVLKGTAVYTANTSYDILNNGPLTAIANTVLLTCQNNRFKDSSNNNATSTLIGSPRVVGFSPFAETNTSNGSMYFDGTGDYVQMPTPYNFGSNNFTVEGWFYLNSISGTQGLWGSSNGGGIQPKFQPYISSGNISLDFNGSSVVSATASTYLQAYAWNHIAFCRGGTGSNQTALFINGVRAAVGTVGSQTGITVNFNIGTNESGVIGASYISNFRIVDGTDVYGYTNTTYTVPSTPLTTIANTRLLTLQNSQPHNNHGLIDESNNKFLISRSGNLSQGTFTPFSADPGKWCVYFNGSSGVRFADNAAFQFGTSAFTVEGWFNVNSTPSNDASVISKWVAANDGNSSWMVDFQSSNLSAAISIGGSVTRITGTVGVPLGVWNHFALVRSGSPGTLSLFMNGARIATATPTGSLVDDTNPLGLGVRGGTDGYYLTGSLTNIRVINGTALYDPSLTSYTVPTDVLTAITNTKLLTCQNNQFIDNSTANSGVGFGASTLSVPLVQAFSPFTSNTSYTTANTGGSLRFDGSGDYFDITDYANLMDIGGRAAHLEFWYYPTATGTQVVLGKSGGTADWGAAGFEYQLQYANSGTFRFYWNASGTPTSIDLVKPPGAWYHIVMASDASNNLALFVNGVRAGTGSNAVTKPGTRTSFRFGNDLSGNYATGIMSGLRFVSGNNAYSPTVSTITVPTVPPRNIANTVLLVNSTYGAIIDSTGKNIIETVADAKANNSLGKFLGSSMYFDGTGDEVLIPDSPYFDMGGGNFTVEFWFNAASARNCSFFTKRASNASYAPIMVQFTTSSTLILYVSTSGSGWAINQTSAATTLNTWHHCAMVRNGTSVVLYLDGVSVASGTMSGSVMTNSSQFVIGADDSAGNLPYQGHISDFRITRSARYTTTFTPPTKSFANR